MAVTRQRGVKASRSKLEHYMLAAGIRSQAELARRIADAEGLDSAPRDLVNRIFRQQKVEYSSLERVAKALQVEAFLLYLNQEEQDRLAGVVQPTAASREVSGDTSASFGESRGPVALIFGLLLLSGIGLWFFRDDVPVVQADLDVSHSSSLLMPLQRDLYPLVSAVADLLPRRRLGVVPPALFGAFDVEAARTRFEVDQVFTLDLEEQGRYRLVHISRYAGKHSQTLVSVVLSKNEFEQAQGYLAGVLDRILIDAAAEHAQAVEDARLVVQARQLAELYYDAENMRQALGRLDNIQIPTASSLALRCLISVSIGWHSNEQASLDRARGHCEDALIHDAEHPFVLSSNAYRMLRSGDSAAASIAYAGLIGKYPGNIEGLLGQAELSMQRYLQQPSEEELALQAAISLAQQAIAREPEYWRGYQQLGSYYYLAGNAEESLEVFQRLVELAPNTLTIANGALLSLCRDQIEEAEALAGDLLALDGDSYLAYETLFYIYAYQGRLEEALNAMERAMSVFEASSGGLYLQWGQLGDAYRWLGNEEAAGDSYSRALVEYEQDKIKQLISAQDQVYPLYYQLAMEHARAGSIASTRYLTQLEALDPEQMSPSHQLKAAIMYHWMSQPGKSASLLERVARTCPVYRRSHDLELPVAGRS